MGTYEVIALFGPTAVGKTAVSIEFARRAREAGQDPVVVSADALQVYRGLEILTGAATGVDRAEFEHRLISFLPLEATFSAGEYARLAHREIDSLLVQDRLPIVVGGTGLYLRAALADLSLRPPPSDGVRERWTVELELHGSEALHARLVAIAPWAASAIAATDSHRIVRALELHDAGELEPPATNSELWTQATRHRTLLVGLTAERGTLYEQINARIDAMLEAGAEREVRRAAAAGASLTARKALGFEDLLNGDVEAMKRRTRNYAKRQLTWMRKLPGITEVDVTGRDAADVAAEIAGHWLR